MSNKKKTFFQGKEIERNPTKKIKLIKIICSLALVWNQ